MKTLTKILLSSLFLIIAGCSTTPKDMRADANEKGTVLVDLPFNVVRDNFLKQAKRCYGANMRVSYSEHVVEDVKPGEFTTLNILHKGATSMVRVTHSFDLRKDLSGGTEITWYVAGLITKNFKPTIEYWTKGLEGRCGTVYDK